MLLCLILTPEMKKLSFYLLLLSFFSCSTKHRNEISLFNDITFELREGETLQEIQPCITQLYQEYFNTQKIQIPLFKYIKHKDYVIFIGIPYNTSIAEMITIKSEKQDSCHLNLRSNTNTFFSTYKKNGFYISEYATVLEDNSIIYVSTMAETKRAMDSLFTNTRLSERIKLKSRRK